MDSRIKSAMTTGRVRDEDREGMKKGGLESPPHGDLDVRA
jgi:hypothetical protein